MTRSGVSLSRFWCHISLWICHLQSLLNPDLLQSDAGHGVHWFWVSWEELWCRAMEDPACGWPLAACLELQVIPVCGCLRWAWVHVEGPSCAPKPLLPALGQGAGQQQKSHDYVLGLVLFVFVFLDTQYLVWGLV